MSANFPCTCDERKKPMEKRKWVVVQYKCNYSAFSGYHHTHSDYSQIICKGCSGNWRTKAAYVEKLKHGSID